MSDTLCCNAALFSVIFSFDINSFTLNFVTHFYRSSNKGNNNIESSANLLNKKRVQPNETSSIDPSQQNPSTSSKSTIGSRYAPPHRNKGNNSIKSSANLLNKKRIQPNETSCIDPSQQNPSTSSKSPSGSRYMPHHILSLHI